MGWYRAGTVSVTKNSTAVVGTGTAFLANARVGDGFRGPDGAWYEVDNIVSNTTLSITPGYLGATVATGVYAIMPVQGYVKDSADALRQASSAAWQLVGQKSQPGGLASLDVTGVVPTAQLPTTDKITEGTTNRWWTNARSIGSTLGGMVLTNSAVVLVTDSILTAIGKLQTQNTVSGWGVPGFKASPADLNSMDLGISKSFTTGVNTANSPYKLGSTTTRFDAGSSGYKIGYADDTDEYHWAMMLFDRTSSAVAVRRSSGKNIRADDYLVLYPTGKTVLDATQLPAMFGATASAVGRSGIVPAPAAGDQAKFLAGDGTYKSVATTVSYGTITGYPTDSSAFVTELSRYQLKSDIVAANQVIAVGTFTTAAPPVLSASNNIASVTRVAVGTYTINMTRTLKAGFKVLGFTGGRGGSSYVDSFLVDWTTTGSGNTAAIRVLMVSGTTLVDPNSAPTQVVIIGEWA
ncbi:hypothetical protein [Pseudomonas sp. LF245]